MRGRASALPLLFFLCIKLFNRLEYGSVVIGLCQDRICAFNELDETARPMCLADCLDVVAELSSDYEG